MGTKKEEIVMSSEVPEVGSKVNVDGYIATSFKLGILNLGTIIRESQRSEKKFIEPLF